MESVYLHNYNGHKIACALSDAKTKKLVIFCHGFRGSSIGPNRFFVELTRKLSSAGISTMRFDQYGSGNSEGSFLDSSFNDWVDTTKAITKDYKSKGFQVSLIGQSMGASAVIDVGSQLDDLKGIVAWVPDPNIEDFIPSEKGTMEEGGQVVKDRFWKEAYSRNTAIKLKQVKAPMYIVQCSDDEYVSAENHQAIVKNALPNHTIEMFKGYKHSNWTKQQADTIIMKTYNFLIEQNKP